MQCHSPSVSIPYCPFNFDMLWALKLLAVGVPCLDWNLELASRRVVDLCGVARYVRLREYNCVFGQPFAVSFSEPCCPPLHRYLVLFLLAFFLIFWCSCERIRRTCYGLRETTQVQWGETRF